MNQKSYNKCLINLVCSVGTGKYLPSFFSHRARSFVARSVQKPRSFVARSVRKPRSFVALSVQKPHSFVARSVQKPRSFVARSVRKPQANTFPYRHRTRLISL